MTYYDSNNNKIRRKKISYNNLENTSSINNRANYTNKKENNKINRKQIDEKFQNEKETFYKKRQRKRRKRNVLIKKSLTILLVLAFMWTILTSIIGAISIKESSNITRELIYSSYISKNIVSIDEIPDDLKNAIVATEDKRFYKHNGVDYKSLIRSVVNNILSDSIQGGSTIDMQVSKNLLTNDEKTMKRKIKDMYNAIKINKIMTKDEILGVYLNNIYFGKSSYGVVDAAKTYFGKDVRDLNLSECAMLAGITNNPAKYMQHDEAKIRQKVVLKNMYDQGYITEEEYRAAVIDPTPFKSKI